MPNLYRSSKPEHSIAGFLVTRRGSLRPPRSTISGRGGYVTASHQICSLTNIRAPSLHLDSLRPTPTIVGLMADTPVWNETLPYGLTRKSVLTSGMECLAEGYFEQLAYIGDPSTLCHFPRPTLHIDTTGSRLSAFESHSDSQDGDYQRRQLSYICSFREGVPGFEESPPATHVFNVSDATLWAPPSPAYPQSSATSTTYTGSCIASPRASRHSFSQSPERHPVDLIAMGSPSLDSIPPEEPWRFPTIVDRFSALSPSSQRLFRTCGSDPFVQSAVLDVLESPELQARAAITSAMAEPLLEKVRYTAATDGKGKRGAPQFYKCRWGSCGDKIARKLHALEHIMTHAGNRSHICDHCGKGFVRKNELKKHSPCKALKRKLKLIDRESGPSPPESNIAAEARSQELSVVQPPYSNPITTSPSCYSPQQTYLPALASGPPPAQFNAFDTESSAANTWETQADFEEAGYFSYSQPVRVTHSPLRSLAFMAVPAM